MVTHCHSRDRRDAVRGGCGKNFLVLRPLLPPDWLPYNQVDFPAAISGRADGVCRFRLADLFVTARPLSTYLKILGILAEASLMLWLIVMGVNEQRSKKAPTL